MGELRELGFRKATYTTHPSGIILYYGTYENADWAVTIPTYLVNRVCGEGTTTRAFDFYDVTYDMAISIIKKYLKGWVDRYAKNDTNIGGCNKQRDCGKSYGTNEKHPTSWLHNSHYRQKRTRNFSFF